MSEVINKLPAILERFSGDMRGIPLPAFLSKTFISSALLLAPTTSVSPKITGILKVIGTLYTLSPPLYAEIIL